MRFEAVEQTWLDEETALKAAALKGVGGSSPSCSAIRPELSSGVPVRSEHKRTGVAALIAAVYVPVIGLIGLACWLSVSLRMPIGFFLRDPASVANLNPLVGLLSNVGVLLWGATTTICLFASKLLIGGARQAWSRFFLAFGILSALLMVDDLWLVHEYWWRQLPAATSAIPLEFAYMAILAGLLLVFRRVILATKWTLLLGALVLFSISVGVDLFAEKAGRWHQLVEDGPKLLGIAAWFCYFVSTAWQAALDHKPVYPATAESRSRR